MSSRAMATAACALALAFAFILPRFTMPVEAQAARASASGAPAPAPYVPPTGPAPRTRGGKPDLSGVWEHPYVPDMTRSDRNPATQKGTNPLPLNTVGLDNIKNY